MRLSETTPYPYEYRMGAGVDVDFASCYGSALRDMTYPIGLPTIWSYHSNETTPTLGEWLRKNERELVDGKFQIIVSGLLPFEQDLIYSTVIDKPDTVFAKVKDGSKINDKHFCLLRREIRNGVITSDILKTLQAVSTNSEWSAIKQLHVVTATGYRASDRVDSVGEWCKTILDDDAIIVSSVDGTLDKRSRCWFDIPLSLFVGRLIEERKKHSKNSPANSLMKLIINTLYGDISSSYFSVGNVILGNNITAKARNAVWMLNKALHTRQSITDGGIYDPMQVPMYCDKKAGLDKLSRIWEWESTKYKRGYVSLDATIDIDKAATEHYNRFWAPYGLCLYYDLEHKRDNQFQSAAYWNKSDYALQLMDGSICFKLRGKKQHATKLHPLYKMLENIINNDNDFPTDLEYTRSSLLKIGKWKLAQASNGYANLKELRPGDRIPDSYHIAKFNNKHIPTSDYDIYSKRHRRKSDKLFEKFGREGVEKVHLQMLKDVLRGSYSVGV